MQGGSFSAVDYIIFIGTLVISVLIGFFYAFFQKQKTNADLLVGGRDMSVFPIALSLLATYMSAILVLGFAGEIYAHGTLISEAVVGTFFFVPIAGLLFLPTLYNLKLTSAYEYLELRFQSKAVRIIASTTFIIQIILYMGVVVYAPSLALKAVVNFPIWASIISIGGCAALYTSIGGLKAVVWTDVFQVGMMYAGILAIIIQGSAQMGGFSNVLKVASENSRIEFLNFTFDPFLRHSSWNIFFGQGIMWLASYGCHQTTVQRYCSMSSLKKAYLAQLCTAPLLSLTMGLASISGIVIFANYATCDPISLGFIEKPDQIAPYFVLEVLSPIDGLLGLFIACLFSGSLSTVSSGLNSLAAVTWEDFCKQASFFRNMSEGRQGIVTKIIGFSYGVITIFMGFVASNLGGVLPAALAINGAVAGPLLGSFILGILIPIANKTGAIAGMLTSHTIVMWIAIGGLLMNKDTTHLPYRIDGCSEEKLHMANFTLPTSPFHPVEMAWSHKIFTFSYVLYPVLGMIITVVVGSTVSLLTGPMELTKDNEKFIHPVIVLINRKLIEKRSREEEMKNGDLELQRPKSETISSVKSIRSNLSAKSIRSNKISDSTELNSIKSADSKHIFIVQNAVEDSSVQED